MPVDNRRGAGRAGRLQTRMSLTFVIGTLLLLPSAQAQTPAAKGTLAIEDADLRGSAALTVESPAFADGATLPPKYADYGHKLSAPLRWSGAPAGTLSFVVLLEDPDAQEPKPFAHWLLYDLPAAVTQLSEGVPNLPRLPRLGGALQGRNSRGSVGYFGPRPPRPDPAHHYHFEVFALDRVLHLDPLASRDQLLDAMRSHVLASGQIVGLYRALD